MDTEGNTVEQTQPELEASPEEVQTEEAPKGLPSDDTFEMPEKFTGKSAEEIARAYVELERMKAQNQEQEVQEEQTPEEAPETNKYLEEFKETGQLSEDSVKELIAQGYTPEQVDDMVEFERYKQHKQINEVVDVIGGMQEYTAMEQWAINNIPLEEREQFTAEFAAAGTLAKKAMLKDIYSMYQADIGGESILHTNQPQYVRTKGYTSQHELQKDMADPRYGTDRSYTQEVEKKVAISNF